MQRGRHKQVWMLRRSAPYPSVNRRLGGGQRASAPRTRAAATYLRGCEDSLPAGHHLIPLVMQHVHEAVRLVAAHELRHVAR